MKIKIEKLLFIFVFIACLLFQPDDSLDLFRYFENARTSNTEMTIYAYAHDSHEKQFDFIYQTILFCCHKYNIPLAFINSIFVLFYLLNSRKLVRYFANDLCVSNTNYILSLLILCLIVPFIYIFSISRMVAAFSFLFLSIYYFFKRKYLFSLILCILSVFTHIGSIIYILVFIISYVLANITTTSHKKLTIIGCILTLFGGMILLKVAIGIITSFSFFGVYSYFLKYLEDFSGISFDGQSTITILASLWALLVYGTFSLLLESNRNSNILTFLFLILAFSVTLNNMFFQRTLLFVLPFISVSSFCIEKKYSFIRNVIVVITVFISSLTYIAYYKNFI